MLAVVLAATLLAALASFTGIVTGYAVRRTLAGNPGTAVIVTASVSGPAAARAAERGGRNAETHVTAVDGLQAHAALVRGGWPTAAGRTGPVPAAVTAAEARRLHLARRGAAGADHRDPATARPGEPVLAARRPAVPAAVRWRL